MIRRSILWLSLAGIAALLLLQSLGVVASPRRDSDDARGPLDVRRVAKVFLKRPLWKVETYDRWTARRILDRGYMLVYLDSFGDERADYYVLVRSAARRLRGLLFRDRLRPARDRRIARIDVWRVDLRSASFRVPLRKMIVGSRRRVLRWYAQTLLTSRLCKRVCFDRVPDSGLVEDALPGPAPSPEPTED